MRYRVIMHNGGEEVNIIHLNTEEEADTLFAIAVASKMYTYVSAEKMVEHYSPYDGWMNAEVRNDPT